MDNEQGHAAYFHLSECSWDDIGPDLVEEIRQLAAALLAVSSRRPDADSQISVAPASVAQQCASIAARLFQEVAPDEADVRQVITTLRTALTVCWDMYGIEESRQTTVREHMDRLRSDIESFEADLVSLRSQRESDQHDRL